MIMREDKVKAARRLVESLESDEDIDDWLCDHPNAETALRRLSANLQVEALSDTIDGVANKGELHGRSNPEG
jgi:hypothetical protein